MTVTASSLAAWDELRDSPRLTKLQLTVLQALRRFGPGTARELSAAAGLPDSIQKRLSELTDAGQAVRLEDRACRVTGRSATVWQAKDSRTDVPSISCVGAPFLRPPGPSGAEHGASFLPLTVTAEPPPERVASRRYTTSSRTPGRVNVGTVYRDPYKYAKCQKCGRMYVGGPWHSPHWVTKGERLVQVDCVGEEVRR